MWKNENTNFSFTMQTFHSGQPLFTVLDCDISHTCRMKTEAPVTLDQEVVRALMFLFYVIDHNYR